MSPTKLARLVLSASLAVFAAASLAACSSDPSEDGEGDLFVSGTAETLKLSRQCLAGNADEQAKAEIAKSFTPVPEGADPYLLVPGTRVRAGQRLGVLPSTPDRDSYFVHGREIKIRNADTGESVSNIATEPTDDLIGFGAGQVAQCLGLGVAPETPGGVYELELRLRKEQRGESEKTSESIVARFQVVE